MTPPDPQQVAEIAGRLSKAQARRLDNVYRLRCEGLSWASKYGSLRAKTSRVTTSALVAIGLLVVVDGGCCITPLGLAVRNFIQGNSHD